VTDSPARLALVGFHGSALAALQHFFDRHTTAYRLVAPCMADGIVYNADQALPLAQQLESYQTAHAKPGLVISVREIVWPGMLSVKKPYSTETLQAALASLQEQLTHTQTAADFGDDSSQHQLHSVADQFRNQMGRGHDERHQALQRINDQAERRRIYQNLFMARKQAADDVLARLKSGTMAEWYATPAADPDADDLLRVTEQIIHGRSATPTQPASAPSAAVADTLDLPPATAQQIHDCCGHAPDLNLSVANQRRRIFFNPEGQLLALAVAAIQRAHADDASVALLGLHHHRLVYLPDNGKFYADVDTQYLIQMAHLRFRFGELRLQHCAPADTDQMLLSSDWTEYPADQLIWHLACWSSRGRLIGGIDIDRAYRLERCPTAAMLIGLPFTAQIIRAWMKESLTPEQLMLRLGVQQRFLFPFMTAAWALGWLQAQPDGRARS